MLTSAIAIAEMKSGPPLPLKLVKDWAQLPAGMNFGETSGVAVDKGDNVWIFNRGAHPVMQFDKNGKLLQTWKDVPVTSSHGIRVDDAGDVWLIDVAGHQVIKCAPNGRVKLVITQAGRKEGNDASEYAFNRPTGVAFSRNGDFFVSDGYVNSRVVKYSKDGQHLLHWGKKGTADGEFTLVHDVQLDSKGRVYIADRANNRVQVFDENGKFLAKWTDLGQPWGLIYSKQEDVLYMCDGENNRVIKVNLEGQILGVLGSFGKAQGQFDFPHNIAVDSTGAIYVAEIKNWRVQKFVPAK